MDPIRIKSSSKKALVFGASGLVGSHVLSLLSDHPAYDEIHAFYRSGDSMELGKLYKHVIDFEKVEDWSDLVVGNDLFICLGTTISKAGSKKVFFHWEYDYITSIAQIAAANGVGQILLISSIGADAKSMFFYSQVKGLIEEALKKMDFWAVHFLRPSLLLGERNESTPRTLESIASGAGLALKALAPTFFKNTTPIEASKVANYMVKIAQNTRSGVFWHTSGEMAKGIQ